MFGLTARRRLRSIPVRLRNWTPISVLDTDIFLVSFPKSGNTWLRFMLANVIVHHAKLDTQIDFKTLHQILPDMMDHIPRDAAFPPFPRIIKSHAAYNSRYPRVIYIGRDVRDVEISMHASRQRDGHVDDNTSIDATLYDRRYGVDSWRKHVGGWLDAGLGENLLLLRYEDMVDDPATALTKCVSFCGVEPQSDIIDRAVQDSSFVNMVRLEETEGVYLGASRPGARFVRKAQPGEWKEVLSSEQLRYCHDKATKAMKLLGYEVDGSDR